VERLATLMGIALANQSRSAERPARPSTAEPTVVRWLLVGTCLLFVALFLLLPLLAVFTEALRRGAGACLASVRDPDAWSAIRLTLLTAAIAVPVNIAFGLCAAWAIGKFRFRGRALLTTLIDLPLSVSPVVAGLLLVLLFGLHGWLGPALSSAGIRIIFAVPGIVLATLFVTLPYVAREVIPLMEEQGIEEEQAATVLGAGGWQTFRRVTLPNIKWAVLYGAILCNARAMGEFGAVSVVSGGIRGETNTLPLHVEVLYNEYDFVGAFTMSSLLAMLALVTLLLKALVEFKARRDLEHGQEAPG
jgi:sulfate transport system permease protein